MRELRPAARGIENQRRGESLVSDLPTAAMNITRIAKQFCYRAVSSRRGSMNCVADIYGRLGVRLANKAHLVPGKL